MDYTQSPSDLLMELVNDVNATAYVASDFDFGAPGAGAKEGFNATITLTAKVGSGLAGSQTFNYNRIALGDVGTSNGAAFSVEEGEDVNDLLTKINTAWGTALTLGELTGLEIPEETGPVTVTLAAGHIVFTGSVELTITVPPKPDPELTDVFPETDLEGFQYGA